VIAFAAYLYSLQRLSVELMSIYAYINPIVAVLLSSVLFNEKLTVYIIVGGGITLYGVWMISHALRKDAREKDVLS
jgi:drug/metabolite transporter (DMT)-like permease